MDLARLGELKALMQISRDLSKVWEYFLDHFGDDPSFSNYGHRIMDDHHMLYNIMKQLSTQILAPYGIRFKECYIANPLLIHIPEYHFIHGCGAVNGFLTNVLYFEDIKLGMGYMWVEEGKSEFARFSLAAPPPGSVSNN